MGLQELRQMPLTLTERKAIVPPSDILIEDSQLPEYLQKYNGDFRELDNGAHFIGFARGAIDSVDIDVRVVYPHSTVLDDKDGKSHFTEHFFPSSAAHASTQLDISQNAFTGNYRVGYSAYGAAVSDIQEFGQWPFAENIVATLTDPFSCVEDPEVILEGQRQRIMTEIIQYNFDQDYVVERALAELFFSLDNPRRYVDRITGTVGDIQTINLQEVREQAERLLNPAHAIVEILGTGSAENNSRYIDHLAKLFAQIPKRDPYPNDLPAEIHDILNPDFQEGATYVIDSGLQNHQATIHCSWLYQAQDDTLEERALSEFRWLAQDATYHAARTKGWGYESGTSIDSGPGAMGIFSVWTKIATLNVDGTQFRDPVAYAEQFAEEVQQDVLSIPTVEIEKNNAKQKLIRKHVPISLKRRLGYFSRGIRSYGRGINGDKMSRLEDQITTEHVVFQRDQFLGRPPTITVIGDLRSH